MAEAEDEHAEYLRRLREATHPAVRDVDWSERPAPTLTEFLTARLDEDARDTDDIHDTSTDAYTDDCQCDYPARVLREVEAKRAIVSEHADVNDGDCGTCVVPAWGYPTHGGSRPELWPCPTLRHLAAVYADHPDYRADWRPQA